LIVTLVYSAMNVNFCLNRSNENQIGQNGSKFRSFDSELFFIVKIPNSIFSIQFISSSPVKLRKQIKATFG